MWLDRAPQYFRFKCNGLVFVGCVATKRPMLTSNSDTGHRCGSVFKQVKGGKLPDFAFLFLTFVSNKKTKWERQRHLGPFVIGLWPALLPHTPLYPSTHAWSSLTRPRPMNGQNPPVSSLLYSFFSLEWPFFHSSFKAQFTHPFSVQASQMPPWNLPSNNVMLTQPLTQRFITAIL